MRAYKVILIQSQELDVVMCNMCGEVITRDSFGYMHDHISIEKKWGFGTCHDGETHHIDMCQQCYAGLLSKMKLPATVKE